MSGENATPSPGVNDEVDPSKGTGTDTGTSTVGSEAHPSQTQPPGDAAAKEPSELTKLKEKLTGVPATPAAASAAVDDPPGATEDPPAETTDDAPTPKANAPTDQPPADEHEGHRLSDEEWKALSDKTRRRITDLARRVKALEKQVEEGADAEIVGNGEYIAEFMHELRLTPKQMHDSLQLLKGYLSADSKALPAMVEAVQRLARVTGQPDPLTASAAVTPHQGRLAPRYQELIEVNQFTEEEARLVAAVLAPGGSATTRTTTAAPAAPARTPPAPAPSGVPDPDPQRTRARETTTEDDVSAQTAARLNAAAGKAIVQFLAGQGIQGANVSKHVGDNLWRYMAEAAPDGNPERIPPHQRLHAVEVAHQRWLLDQATAAKARAKAPGSIAGGTTGAAPAASPNRGRKELTELQKLRAKMVGP